MMIRTALLAAALALPLPVVASEWMGSLSYTAGGAIGAWSTSLKGGHGTTVVAGSKVKVVRDGNKIRLSGDGINGSGKVKNGKVSGTFTHDGIKGTFSGKRH